MRTRSNILCPEPGDTLRAVRAAVWQPTASYRLPTAVGIGYSYPLPPLSTVIGMVHAAVGAKHYIPMDIGVIGSAASHETDTYIRYTFQKNGKPEEGRYNIVFSRTEDGDPLEAGIRSCDRIELLHDVRLLLYIVPEDDSLCEMIRDALLYPADYVSLGRREDIIQIDDAEVVTLKAQELERPVFLRASAWFPSETEKFLRKQEGEMDLSGSRYLLNKKYHLEKGRNRIWDEKVDVRYIGRQSELGEELTVYTDTGFGCIYPDGELVPVFPC